MQRDVLDLSGAGVLLCVMLLLLLLAAAAVVLVVVLVVVVLVVVVVVVVVVGVAAAAAAAAVVAVGVAAVGVAAVGVVGAGLGVGVGVRGRRPRRQRWSRGALIISFARAEPTALCSLALFQKPTESSWSCTEVHTGVLPEELRYAVFLRQELSKHDSNCLPMLCLVMQSCDSFYLSCACEQLRRKTLKHSSTTPPKFHFMHSEAPANVHPSPPQHWDDTRSGISAVPSSVPSYHQYW